YSPSFVDQFIASNVPAGERLPGFTPKVAKEISSVVASALQEVEAANALRSSRGQGSQSPSAAANVPSVADVVSAAATAGAPSLRSAKSEQTAVIEQAVS